VRHGAPDDADRGLRAGATARPVAAARAVGSASALLRAAAAALARPSPRGAPAAWTAGRREAASRHGRVRRIGRLLTLDRSPLARRIITLNLIGLLTLVAGVFYLNPFRDSLVAQREAGLRAEARLIADAVALSLPPEGSGPPGAAVRPVLSDLSLTPGVAAFLLVPDGTLVERAEGPARSGAPPEGATILTDALIALWETASWIVGPDRDAGPHLDPEQSVRALLPAAIAGDAVARTGPDAGGGTAFSVAVPVRREGRVVGAVALVSATGEIDALIRSEREQVLQMFVIALLVQISLSIVFASTIAGPLSDLALAAEAGRDRSGRQRGRGRVRIPDLSARNDEIGRLSAALRGMVTALYDRIDANEQFAADVAHEIKNPLASLRSAVGTLRDAPRDDQRARLCTVIEHDVRRLDRLVSDISNASRLDSELVKEEEAPFDLIATLGMLCEQLGAQARAHGVDFITDLPARPLLFHGLEPRLAQVVVNLVTNAISFCEPGDAVRVWARRRAGRVLVVVEDTGPGIPEAALAKIFARFYSERPEGQFGDHSGLGLAISKQIVEAHGGVIWAENIRPTAADPLSEPLGARFVVGLPV